MTEVFVGSAALANGGLTRARLRWNYRPMFPDIYLSKLVVPSLLQKTVGAWLWSGRNGVIAGRAAAAMHGALWIDATTPIEMIWRSARPPDGILVRNERIDADDVMLIDGIPVTTPERTAFDVARYLRRDVAVRHLDALARATGIKAAEVQLLGERYPRARGLRLCTNVCSRSMATLPARAPARSCTASALVRKTSRVPCANFPAAGACA